MTGRITPVGDLPDHGPVSTDLEAPAVALAIGAHPDDVEFGCGATLAKWASAGTRIHHLILTDGSKGTWESGDDVTALVARRHEEQRAAASCLGGGNVDFLDRPDGELASGLDERRQVCAVIRRVQPEVVLGHDPWRRYRLHPDHRHAGWLAVDGVVAARDPQFFPELGLAAHRPRAVLLWEADEPNHVEEVGPADVERKLAALLAHESQYVTTMGMGSGDDDAGEATFRRRVEEQLRAHGALGGIPLGEAFHLIDRV